MNSPPCSALDDKIDTSSVLNVKIQPATANLAERLEAKGNSYSGFV